MHIHRRLRRTFKWMNILNTIDKIGNKFERKVKPYTCNEKLDAIFTSETLLS